ncbi:MAG TPA: maleylpyruvate isomerase family mycothiol-dependent enzyme [Actinomycetota bacterium]|nr:maleylpyruvate isomerase family mycothiol-dependent enzyme [Actinomycetota bacterium]
MSAVRSPSTPAPAAPLTRAEGVALMTAQYDALLDLLRSLSDDEWNTVTECTPWTVKDVVAHLIGWAEAFTSFSEMGHQVSATVKRRSEFGNLLDAQNQVQVDDRAQMSAAEVLHRWEEMAPRFARQRTRFGLVGKVLPLYVPGLFGFTNMAYLFVTIFNRDAFMHRIDISRALGRDPQLGGPEARLIEDVAVDWAGRTGAAARLHLAGPAGGEYAVGIAHRADITTDAVLFARVLSGRGDLTEIQVDGDVDAARDWLKKGCPF